MADEKVCSTLVERNWHVLVVGDPVDHLTHDELAEVELALAHYLGIQDAAGATAR